MSQAAAGADPMEMPTTTGLPNRKMLMWTFIGSECMLFVSLITGYVVNEGRSLNGPFPHDSLSVPFITVTTFVLLMSSLMMVLALSAVQRGDRRKSRIFLFLTALFGMIFLGGQVHEFAGLVHDGLGISTNLFGPTFFILTGTHGAHVTVGVIWLLSLWIQDLRGNLSTDDTLTVEIAGLYWHFVDVVWIVLFTVIYLLE